MALWSYTVRQRYDNGTDAVVNRILDDYIIKIENMTDTGTGEVNSCTLVLNANKGQFITQANSESTPILEEFDRIEIQLEDKNGDTYKNVFEVRTLEIKKSISEGVRLIVRLVGLERALGEVQFAKPFYYENAFTVVRDIIDQYMDNKGTRQPTIIKYDKAHQAGVYYNDLPQWTFNNFDFGQQATSCYEGIDEVVNSLGTSISGGGAGDFFETRFAFSTTADYDTLKFHSFSSGSQPELDGGTITTLESDIITPHYLTTGEINARNGTLICAKGAMGFGSLPDKCMKWWGEFEAFLNGIPEWSATDDDDEDIYYKTGNLVSHYSNSGGPSDPTIKWRALRDNNDVEPNTTNTADWEQIQIGDLITDTNYSPWTDNDSTDGYKMWKACSANPDFSSSNDFDELAVFDGNMYSADKGGSGGQQMQEYVDYYGGSTNSSSNGLFGLIHQDLLYYDSPNYRPYRGFKMLVDSDTTLSGDLEGSFAQNSERDRHGNNYDKAVVKYRGYIETDGDLDYMNWDVIFPTRKNGIDIVPSDGSLCAVIYDGDNRIFDNSYSGSGGTALRIWRSYWKSETKQGVTIVPFKDEAASAGIQFFGGQNHCFHNPDSIEQADGINSTFTRTGSSTSDAGDTYGTNSAVVWKYSFGSLASLPSAAYRNDDAYYKHGAWACIRFPFPATNTFSQTIGSEYGNNASKREPVTVDINNMHLTPSGNVGFNNTEAENLGQIDAIEGFMKLQIKNTSETALRGWTKNFKMRVTCYDTSNNLAVQDFVIPFNDTWYHMKLPIKNFKVYRARRYWGGQDDIGAELFPPELEILEVFMWRNLKMITIQTQDSYDDQGRYHPDNKEPFGKAFGGVVRLYLDNFHFSKQLIATSGVETARNLTPQWLLRPFSSNYYQLKKDVLAQKEIDGFQHQAYDITTEGVCDPDLKFGYSFYLKDDKIVKRADKGESAAGENDGEANTIKLVAKKITYNIDGTTGGQGGFTRTITGVKRFESGE